MCGKVFFFVVLFYVVVKKLYTNNIISDNLLYLCIMLMCEIAVISEPEIFSYCFCLFAYNRVCCG